MTGSGSESKPVRLFECTVNHLPSH